MKKFLSFLIVFVLVVSMMVPFAINIGASAASGTTGDCTWSLDDNGVLTISGNGAMADYDYCCAPWGTSVTEVIIEDGVTTIGDYAFADCYYLTSVTIPDSVTTIGESAFVDCSIDSVYITDMAAWCNIDFEDEYATPLCSDYLVSASFYLNNNLVTKLGIPKGVTAIKDYAFYGYDSITSVTIPDSITTIGNFAFKYCDSLASVTIPDSVVTIGECAFKSCTSLTSVTIPYTVQSIGQWAFDSGTDLSVHEDSAGHTYALENSNDYYLTEHTYDEITTVPSTCTVAGTESFTCNVCGKEVVTELPLADHTFEGEAVIVPATCTTEGTETNYCSVCEQDFVTVLPKAEHPFEDGSCTACGMPDFQSEHPYADNLDQTWTHTVAGAGAVSVTFSEETYVEENIDYIYLYNSADEELGYYTGAQLAGQTVTVRGDTIKIRLVSDSSTNGYGFQVTAITSTPGIEQTTDGVIKLLQYIDGLDVGLTDAVADINGDGKVTVFDAVCMLQNIAGQQ